MRADRQLHERNLHYGDRPGLSVVRQWVLPERRLLPRMLRRLRGRAVRVCRVLGDGGSRLLELLVHCQLHERDLHDGKRSVVQRLRRWLLRERRRLRRLLDDLPGWPVPVGGVFGHLRSHVLGMCQHRQLCERNLHHGEQSNLHVVRK